MRACLTVSALISAVSLLACGEIETVIMPVRPTQSDFPEIQTRLLEVGCSVNGGCHTVLVGNFQVTTAPKPRAQFEAEYLLTKDHVNLDVPERSKLLTVNLLGDPENTGHAVCFGSVCSCNYQAVYAWIAGRDFPGDPQCGEECVPDSCL